MIENIYSTSVKFIDAYVAFNQAFNEQLHLNLYDITKLENHKAHLSLLVEIGHKFLAQTRIELNLLNIDDDSGHSYLNMVTKQHFQVDTVPEYLDHNWLWVRLSLLAKQLITEDDLTGSYIAVYPTCGIRSTTKDIKQVALYSQDITYYYTKSKLHNVADNQENIMKMAIAIHKLIYYIGLRPHQFNEDIKI